MLPEPWNVRADCNGAYRYDFAHSTENRNFRRPVVGENGKTYSEGGEDVLRGATVGSEDAAPASVVFLLDVVIICLINAEIGTA